MPPWQRRLQLNGTMRAIARSAGDPPSHLVATVIGWHRKGWRLHTRRSHTQRTRSAARKRTFGLARESTSSWWRNTRFSTISSRRQRQALIRTRGSRLRTPSTAAEEYQPTAVTSWTLAQLDRMADRDRLLPSYSTSGVAAVHSTESATARPSGRRSAAALVKQR